MRRVIVPVIFAAAASACSLGRSVTPESFGRGTTFAIVTVCASDRVSYTEKRMMHTAGGGMDIGSTGFDAGPAAGVFPATRAAALHALSRSRRYRILPEAEVLSSPAYAAAPGHTGPWYGTTFLTPRGYKLVFDEAAAGRIARATGATGALIVSIQHLYTSVGGDDLAARVVVVVTAVDRSGRKIWKDFAMAPSEHTISSPTKKVAPAALQALFVESADRGVRAILQRLEEGLAVR